MNRALTVTVLLATMACAPSREPAPPGPETLMGLTLTALDRGDFDEAAGHARLLPVGDTTPAGRRALLLRALVGLDPRNGARAPNQAADAAARYTAAAPDPLDAALGRLLYSIALDLGADPSVGASATTAELPRLSTPTIASRLTDLERVVKNLRGELERIQATLKS
jgi:hypothetical protein